MDNETPGTSSGASIGTGIGLVLDTVYKELEGNEAVGTDLDDLFWSSINANAASSTADSLERTFYNSIIEDDNWSPKQQDLSLYDPPRGEPVVPAQAAIGSAATAAAGAAATAVASRLPDPAAQGKEAVINQVADYAVREVEKRIHKSNAVPDGEGDYLLFSNGENGVYVGRPEQYGTLYDNPRDHMKDLLSKFYRGNKQELEQVAQQIIDNAIKGTPVDVKRWFGG